MMKNENEIINVLSKKMGIPENTFRIKLTAIAKKRGIAETDVLNNILSWYTYSKEEKNEIFAEALKKGLIKWDVGTHGVETTEKGKHYQKNGRNIQ